MKSFITRCLLIVVAGALAAPGAAESLWKNRTPAFAALYTDDKARSVGDTLTVIVSESIIGNNDEKAELDRESKTESEVTSMQWFSADKAAKSLFKSLPKFGWDSNREYEGEGKYTANARYDTRLTVIVREVLANGCLLIEGSREIKIGDDVKKIILTGIVRPNDILPNNVIHSQYIANMKLHNEGEGPVSRTRRRGWLGKIAAVVWPF